MPSVSVRRRRHIRLPKNIDGPRKVKVGFPAGKTASDIVDRAIWNHYGTRGGASGGGWGGPVPARPFLLNAIRKNRRKYLAAMKTAGAKILRGEATLEDTMRKLGVLAQGDIQDEITNLKTPPNSPTTIRLKGSSNPLIDTGEMRRAVTWEVKR